MPYLLLFLSVALASANNLLLHGFDNRGLRGMGDVLFFNALISCVWIAILSALNRLTPISLPAMLWGLLYGAVTAAFLLSKMQAMASGPVSVTSFVGCSSLLISTAFGIIAFRETATPLQLSGVTLLICALFLCVSPKADKAKPSWKLWCASFFLCSGAVGIIFKLHQASDCAGEVNGMMLSAAVTSAVIFLCASLAVSKKQTGGLPKLTRGAIPYLLGCGAVSCFYNRLNLTLSGQLPSVVFFPLFNGSVILTASLAAALLFRERLKKTQLAGLILGTLALLLSSGTADWIVSLF